MRMLGFHASRDTCGALFDSLDDDGSGTLEFSELHKKLMRKGGGSKGDNEEFKARFYRGPETPRDRLLLLLPRLGAKLLASLTEHDADADDEVTCAEFVRAVISVGPLKGFQSTYGGGSNGDAGLVEALRNVFAEVSLGTGQLPIGSALARIRKLAKQADQIPQPKAVDAPDIDVGPSALALSRLRVMLHAAALTAVQLFEAWDEDKSGYVERDAFRKALPCLHIACTRAEADALFDSLDTEGKGAFAYQGLAKRSAVGVPVRTRVRSAGPKPQPSSSQYLQRSGASSARQQSTTVPASQKQEYISGMMESISSAYFLPKPKGGHSRVYSPRVRTISPAVAAARASKAPKNGEDVAGELLAGDGRLPPVFSPAPAPAAKHVARLRGARGERSGSRSPGRDAGNPKRSAPSASSQSPPLHSPPRAPTSLPKVSPRSARVMQGVDDDAANDTAEGAANNDAVQEDLTQRPPWRSPGRRNKSIPSEAPEIPRKPASPRRKRNKPGGPRHVRQHVLTRPSRFPSDGAEAGIETEMELQREALGAALERIKLLEQMVSASSIGSHDLAFMKG
jgi:Ca2+-binding EF-hand superfamily protein